MPLALAGLLATVATRRAGRGRPADNTGAPDWQATFSRPSDLEFRRLLERLPAAAYTCDTEGLITYFNPRAVELWGREPRLNDPIDRFCGSFKIFAPDGTPIPHERCWMALALQENRAYNGEEIVIERPDGSHLTVLAHANPLHDDGGRVIGAVNVLVDITDRKRAEQVLHEADRIKNEFLATLAHELRSPLAPMTTALEVMRRSDDDATAEQARNTLQRQVSHLTRIVDDLLDLSRITRNELELRPAPVDLASIIGQAVETSRPLADCAAHRVEVVLPAEPVRLRADPVRLTQLFANLLTNACKYTPDGGRISVTAAREGAEATISVTDTGIGISPELLPRVFDMFRRSEESVARSEDGLGIGLTLARRVAELHGGTIQASSAGPGSGSTFTVRLPVLDAAEPDAPDPATTNGREPAVTRRRILVVDDHSDAAESLSELLELTGHDVHTVHDGLAALDAAESLRPDAVLLDIGLPGMSGYDIARQIRRQPWGRRLLLVALTGWGQAKDRRRSREAGFDRHLVKPIDFGELEELLAEPPERPEG